MPRKRTGPVLDPPDLETHYCSLPLDQLHPAADNPRRAMSTEDLAELTDSVKALGVLTPLIVRPHPLGGYLVVAGHRRLAAAQSAGLAEVPCVVRALTEPQRAEVALVENLQRVDLTPMEEARALHALVELTGASQRELAPRVGRSQGHISKRLSLLALPPAAVEALDAGGITLDQGIELSRLPQATVEALFAGRRPPGAYEIDRAVRDHERNERMATARKELAKAGVTVLDTAPGPRWHHQLDHLGFTGEQHAGEPCHAVLIDDRAPYGEPICTDPGRHAPEGESALKPRAEDDDDEEELAALDPEERAAEEAHRAAAAAKRAAEQERFARRLAAIEVRRAFAAELVRGATADDAVDWMLLALSSAEWTEVSVGTSLQFRLLDVALDTYSMAGTALQLERYAAKGTRNRARALAAVAVGTLEPMVTPSDYQLRRADSPLDSDQDLDRVGRAYLAMLADRGYELSDHDLELFAAPSTAAPDPDAEGADDGLAWYTGDGQDDPARWVTDQAELENIGALYPERLVDLDGEQLDLADAPMAAAAVEPVELGAEGAAALGGSTMSICRDEDCPGCGWPETYAEGDAAGPTAIGCRKCGWRQEVQMGEATGEEAEAIEAPVAPVVTVRRAGRGAWITSCGACGELGRNTTEALAQQRGAEHHPVHSAELAGASS